MEEAERQERESNQVRQALQDKWAAWPAGHMMGLDGKPVPFHRAQQVAIETPRRIAAMLAGTQSGKTSFGPWWLADEIRKLGGGDYLAVTANFDLFKLKMLPAMRETFETILGWGRYWAGDKIIELRDPATGEFWAERANDKMWARIILRSAVSKGGLESSTAKAAWLDEAGQDEFEVDAWRAVRRRLALYRGRVLITTTLYNLGWLKQQVVDRAVDGGKTTIEHLDNGAEVEVTENAKSDIALIQFDSIANPMFPMEEYAEAKATLPADEFEMLFRGRVAKLRTLIYDVFDTLKHTCPPFEIPTTWRRFLGLDFGGVNTAGVFYAEEPGTEILYAYREYLEGGKSAKEHAQALLEGEPMVPKCYGGSKSEDQWRKEFRAGGLPVREPLIADVNLGILQVYSAHKAGKIIYFNDLEGILDQKGRYKRKRDKNGNVTDEIEDKSTFHFLDAERYVIQWVMRGGGMLEYLRKKAEREAKEKAERDGRDWNPETDIQDENNEQD